MNRRHFLYSTLLTGAASVASRARAAQTASSAPELRLVFSRGGDLFACSDTLGADARRVLTLGANALWAVSPNGRRLVWMPQSTDPEKPATVVYLSDMLGRHQKKLLDTADLRDFQNDKVGKMGVEDATDLSAWSLDSLTWSVGGRTIYIGAAGGTFAADAVSGAALVDAEKRWKRIAPLSQIDAKGGFLVGIGKYLPEPEQSNPVGRGVGALVLINLSEGGKPTIYGSQKPLVGAATLAPYDYAESPSLSPGLRSVAYVSGIDGGLWVRDLRAEEGVLPRRIAQSVQGPLQWTQDGTSLFFMISRRVGENNVRVNDLYQVAVPAKGTEPAAPRLVIKNVDSFALAPF